MKNKLIIITISAILVSIITGVSFYFFQKRKEIQNSMRQSKVTENNRGVENDVEEEAKEDLNNNKETEGSKEEIEKLKNDNSLVWYEVPELGIKFKVTPYTKEDLKYFKENESVYFYKQSLIDFIKFYRHIDNVDSSYYSIFAVNRKFYKTKNSEHFCDKIFSLNKEEFICYSLPQAAIFNSEKENNEYLESIKSKKDRSYFSTVEEMK